MWEGTGEEALLKIGLHAQASEVADIGGSQDKNAVGRDVAGEVEYMGGRRTLRCGLEAAGWEPDAGEAEVEA